MLLAEQAREITGKMMLKETIIWKKIIEISNSFHRNPNQGFRLFKEKQDLNQNFKFKTRDETSK